MSLLPESNQRKLEMHWILGKGKHDPKVVHEKIAKNIREFKKIDALPIDLYLDEGNNNLGKLFIENSAKFHKSCTNMFSDLKLEIALKRVQKAANDNNNDQQGSDEDETQSSNGEISERITSVRSKCIFCENVYSVILQRENYIKCRLFHWTKSQTVCYSSQ